MSLINTLKFIIRHPLNRGNEMEALTRFVKWQISTRLTPYPVIYPFTSKAKLIVQKGMSGAIGTVYCGLYEFNDMSFLLHFLRKNDLFIDVGANVGIYTLLSAAHLETETITVEPVPATFEHLRRNILLNKVDGRVSALNIALGAAPGKLQFTTKLDAANHVTTGTAPDTIEVEVNTLDNILAEKSPSLLKIDVEGFETAVLEGAHVTLAKETLKAIIIELIGLGGRYGYDEMNIHALLVKHNFQPYIYNPFLRKLIHCPTFGKYNIIYVRDIQFVEERIRTAEKIRLRNKLV